MSQRNGTTSPGAGALVILAAAVVSAASPPRPVEQGVADRDLLSTSLRLEPIDQRTPTHFERVYRLEDVMRRGEAFGGVRRASGFVRFDAGIAAVFPRSEYTEFAGGQIAEVPPGTVFHIGLRPEVEERRPLAPPTYNAVDLSARGASALHAAGYGAGDRVAKAEGPEARSMWGDEPTRRLRVATLLDDASKGGR